MIKREKGPSIERYVANVLNIFIGGTIYMNCVAHVKAVRPP